MKNISFVILLLVICSYTAYTQSLSPTVITSAGNYHQSSTGSLQWTIGEPVIETFVNAAGILTQGFQQSNYNVSDYDSTKIIPFGGDQGNTFFNPEFSARVFPNPVSDFININILSEIEAYTKIELIDFNGKSIFMDKFRETSFQINLQSIPPGIYFLRISNPANGYFKSFKIEKTYN